MPAVTRGHDGKLNDMFNNLLCQSTSEFANKKTEKKESKKFVEKDIKLKSL